MKNGGHYSCVKTVNHNDRRVATNEYWLVNDFPKTMGTCHFESQVVVSEVPVAIDRGAITFEIRYSHQQNWRLHRYILITKAGRHPHTHS